MDGVEFLERQHEEPAFDGVPAIVTNARPQHLRMLPPTVRAVLEKPFTTANLLQLVDDLLKSS
jgi:CheY-like chemotaxis protein